MTTSPAPIRLVHVSDWHLCCYPKAPLKYFSKRFLAYAGTKLSPHRRFNKERLDSWFYALKQINPTHVAISGDLSTAQSEEEFTLANKWIEKIREITPNLVIVPGNHDVYINRSEREGIYPWLQKWMPQSPIAKLFHSRVLKIQQGDIEFILLDQCKPTPYGQAQGIFSKEMAAALTQELEQTSQAPFRFVIGHYPMHATTKPSQVLEDYALLADCLKGHRDIIYLHGHNHIQHLIDERYFGYPLSLDSGSLCLESSPSFNLLELFTGSLKVTMKRYETLHGWQTRQVLVTSTQNEDRADRNIAAGTRYGL